VADLSHLNFIINSIVTYRALAATISTLTLLRYHRATPTV